MNCSKKKKVIILIIILIIVFSLIFLFFVGEGVKNNISSAITPAYELSLSDTQLDEDGEEISATIAVAALMIYLERENGQSDSDYNIIHQDIVEKNIQRCAENFEVCVDLLGLDFEDKTVCITAIEQGQEFGKIIKSQNSVFLGLSSILFSLNNFGRNEIILKRDYCLTVLENN